MAAVSWVEWSPSELNIWAAACQLFAFFAQIENDFALGSWFSRCRTFLIFFSWETWHCLQVFGLQLQGQFRLHWQTKKNRSFAVQSMHVMMGQKNLFFRVCNQCLVCLFLCSFYQHLNQQCSIQLNIMAKEKQCTAWKWQCECLLEKLCCACVQAFRYMDLLIPSRKALCFLSKCMMRQQHFF